MAPRQDARASPASVHPRDLGEIGFPASALTALLEALANVDERMTALEVGAAARAVRSLGARGHEFAPYLLARSPCG